MSEPEDGRLRPRNRIMSNVESSRSIDLPKIVSRAEWLSARKEPAGATAHLCTGSAIMIAMRIP